jgi:RsiW-degrading membrane proteinase PrsW (M82 family)
MSTMVCRACKTEVPDAAFCGRCGAPRYGGRGRLRLRAYAAAPNEHTLLPSIASSLFPQLPRRSRSPFRIGLILLFLALSAVALARWQAPLITVGALGLPILFLLYLRESEIDDDQPRSTLVLTALMGIALGIAWAFETDSLVVDAYALALSGGSLDDTQTLADTLFVLAFPVSFAVLMLIPTVVIRLVRPGIRESLDGFVIGALGAISFTAAATLTQLAPQFQTGITAGDRSVDTFLIQAGIQVIAVPLTSAALGGLVGVTLWFSRRISTATSVLVTLGFYAAMGLMDAYGFPLLLQLGLYLLIAVLALIAMRIGIQAALMSEGLDPEDASERLTCPHCDQVVAAMAFCPNCGVAARAASRSSRAERRFAPDDATVLIHRTSYSRLFLALGVGAVVTAAGGVVAAVVATPDITPYKCPPDCGGPPIAEPIESYPRYVSTDGAFSVQYPGPGTAYEATLDPDGVSLKFTGGDTGNMELFGMPADGRTPKQIVDYLISAKFPDATTAYEIPNAMVGYGPGYGVVVDVYPNDARSAFARTRLLLMASVKYEYALVAAAIGPYHEFTREFGPGHPSGANLQLAMDMGKYVNSFRWREPTS